jgi:GTPase SAR1 family protein
LCADCHFELTHDAGLVEDRRIAIIGGRNTGKSHYIATLVHKLENEVGSNFGWSLRMIGDATRTRFENDFHGPLFRRKTVLQMTQSAAVDAGVKTPMVFRLSFNKESKKCINFSFFDTAGEDMRSLEAMSTETRYITEAEGLVFLLDPLQIPAVRERLPRMPGPPADPLSEPTYLVDRLCDLFESHKDIRAGGRIKVPVAFVLSKVDAVWPLIEPGSILRRPGEHFGELRRRELDSIHTEVWNCLETWIGSSFNNRVERAFSRFRYFAASALGGSADGAGRLETVAPLRVEDPFLWILAELGFVRIK